MKKAKNQKPASATPATLAAKDGAIHLTSATQPPPPPNPTRDALLEAIRELPDAHRNSQWLLNREASLIATLANDLARERIYDRPASAKKTEQEIEKAKSLAKKLAEHLETIHEPALHALDMWGCEIDKVVAFVRGFELKAGRPEVLENAIKFSSSKRGRPSDTASSIIAYQAAITFWQVTQKEPTIVVDPLDSTASGPFLDFVEKVFQACSITASAEGYARMAKDVIRDFS